MTSQMSGFWRCIVFPRIALRWTTVIANKHSI
jgi:hypothetical protein